MIHPHQHQIQINVSQPPPHMQQQQQPPLNNQPNQERLQRMNHYHHQQRINHQQIQQQQQLPPPQIHGNRPNLGGLSQQHQVPPPIIPKQHLHQNIATLNQKPPQHVSSSQNSQIQPSLRLSYEKPSIQSNNLKRESHTTISVSATATLSQNNSSIVTVPPPSVVTTIPPPQTPALSHHQQQQHHHVNILPKFQTQMPPTVSVKSEADSKTPVVSANKENVPLTNLNSSQLSSSWTELDNTEEGLETLANTKEKTPMCLVNELARYNKIQHQYRLIGEQGPAHKKRFTVILKLGEEEYAAEGLSIKKAQHAAAKDAILKTSYKHPPLKTIRQQKGTQIGCKNNTGNITPTVELNALAMKRGEPTVYSVTSTTMMHGMPPMPNANFSNQPPTSFHPRGGAAYQPRRFPNQRGGANFNGGRFNGHFGTETFHVTLHVGSRSFSGMGPTQQAARHDAAARALEVLKPLTAEAEIPKPSGGGSDDGSTCGDDSLISDIKSPISIVHEMALKRKMTVSFEVQSEKGPPHMKVYTTLCKVGTIVTEGEGNGKKLSKKKAAEKMVDELKKLPPLSPVEEPAAKLNIKNRRKQLQQQQQTPPIRKKSRNLIKEKLETSASTDEINPISQLIQIQQARKEKEPVYTVIDERGTARRREFVIEVSAGGLTASGTGPNKKIAKKIAAENLLILMGVSKATPIVETPPKEPRPRFEDKSKKVQFSEPDAKKSPKPSSPGSSGRQIVPGLLLVSSSSDSFTTPSKPVTTVAKESSPSTSETSTAEKSSSSPASNHDSGIGESGVSPRDQLNYLAQLIGFTVSYSDFPRGNHSEFLSLVSLTTDPAQLSHGSGSTVDESRDQAALKALSVISELGIDNVKPKAK